MTRQHKTSESITAIAGGALVGLGLHILSGNLDTAGDPLRHLLGNPGGDALGVVPSVVLASSQAAQAYALDHHGFLQCFLRMLLSFWPLLLVVVGTVLLWDVFADKGKKHHRHLTNTSKKILPKIKIPDVDFAALRSTYK
jgi:hypothetical protein